MKKTGEMLRQMSNDDLAQALQKNPGNRAMTSELFDRIKEIDSSQAIDLFIYAHPHWRRRAFRGVRKFALQKCYAPAEFELMIQARPDYVEELLDLLHSSAQGRAVGEVHTRALLLHNTQSAVA